ncbi:MAG: hypothetical protein H6738_06615 [Alphaproteobacteria bacterium]|nr:hypothetical protein [Alphaproteobacteria bacterium]MCB9696434.1 hypothetical protein [Alphaproteobacteria bacterium]
MGHGPARELSTESGEIPELRADLAQKLSAALEKLDATNAEFKQKRDDERLAQLVKSWNKTCREIDEHLRLVAKVLIASHQLSLDIGSDGGGFTTKPFLEEMREIFPKLQFKLNEDATVDAVSDGVHLGKRPVAEIDYAWLEEMAVDWAARSAIKVAGG